MTKPHALVIDDEPDITAMLAFVLTQEGWDVTEAASAEEAFEVLQTKNWGVVFSDVIMGGDDGFSVLRRFKQEMPTTPVVLMTGHASASAALDATSFGAYDYLLKPVDIDELKSLSLVLKEQLLNSTSEPVSPIPAPTKFQPELRLLGHSEPFINIMKHIGRIANTDLPVLLSGESGTGREVIASSIHSRSTRRDYPFVPIHCAAMSPEQIEFELFGHLKGAFARADHDRMGLWETADKGTIFLDEVTETTPALQLKILISLQEGEIRRVGSNESRRVDVRVIAASDRNIEEEVTAGRFREDLFYLLNATSIRIPPLRERGDDIVLLAKSCAEHVSSWGAQIKFSDEALKALQRYPWPGNIRELENAMIVATAVCDGTIRLRHLPEYLQKYSGPEATRKNEAERSAVADADEECEPLSVMEGRHVAKVLAHTGGNKQAAARLLNVDRKTLDRMIKRHKIGIGSTHSKTK
ncbi:MAG: sigma-54-dependent transcriptional regulator [Pyrinomonadaceae bacterium]